jgi:aspartyl/asparaginyl beta-hydroxylase (cupin superfamily)
MKLYVSDSSCVHHQEFLTLHTAIVYVIQVFRQLSMFWLLYGVLHYDAANMLVTASRPRLGNRFRRICTASPCTLLMDWVREVLLIESNIYVFLAGVEPRLYGLIVFLS